MPKFYELTISSKGQVTLPADVRRMLAVGVDGRRKLRLEMLDNETAVITVPKSLDELDEYLADKIAGIEPLQDAHELYQTRPIRGVS